MFKSITTSGPNRKVVSDLTKKLSLGAENVIARIAIAYSISNNDSFSIKDLKDSKGKTYSTQVLFGDKLSFYIALICQKYGIYKSNPDIPKYLKAHLDGGLEKLHQDIINYNHNGIDFILNACTNGLKN